MQSDPLPVVRCKRRGLLPDAGRYRDPPHVWPPDRYWKQRWRGLAEVSSETAVLESYRRIEQVKGVLTRKPLSEQGS